MDNHEADNTSQQDDQLCSNSLRVILRTVEKVGSISGIICSIIGGFAGINM